MSMLAFGKQAPWVMPNPDGSFIASDRAQLLYLYSGINLQDPTEAPDTKNLLLLRRRVSRKAVRRGL